MKSTDQSALQNELVNAHIAVAEGNDGKARVCARRAVQIVVQAKYGAALGVDFSSMSALQFIQQTPEFPETIRQSATRLQGGLRAKIEGNVFSENPIDDAEIIIRYFG